MAPYPQKLPDETIVYATNGTVDPVEHKYYLPYIYSAAYQESAAEEERRAKRKPKGREPFLKYALPPRQRAK